MRSSKKRNKIYELFITGDLLTANEVCQRLPEIDRATIYRNLSLLSTEGLIREVNVRKGIASYELSKQGDHHQHLLCNRCQKVVAVDIDLQKLQSIVPKDLDFDEFELNLKGKCSDCK